MRNLFILLLLLSFFFTCNAQIKNPVFVGSELLIYDNEEDMIDNCKKYHPTQLDLDNGFHKFTYDGDTVIQCKIDSVSSNKKIPIVKILTNKSKKELAKTLKEMGYEKEGNQYRKGTKHNQSISVCQFDKHDAKILNFTKIFNN